MSRLFVYVLKIISTISQHFSVWWQGITHKYLFIYSKDRFLKMKVECGYPKYGDGEWVGWTLLALVIPKISYINERNTVFHFFLTVNDDVSTKRTYEQWRLRQYNFRHCLNITWLFKVNNFYKNAVAN